MSVFVVWKDLHVSLLIIIFVTNYSLQNEMEIIHEKQQQISNLF
jgi:hypothetical protein